MEKTIICRSEREVQDAKTRIVLASSDMIVPAEMREDGKEINCISTGVIEFRPTKRDTSKHYGALKVRTEDGLRFSVLQSEFIPEGTPVIVRVALTKAGSSVRDGKPFPETDQWGFTLSKIAERVS